MKNSMIFMALVLILGLCACAATENSPTWQEKYDLGIRYLSEGNYEEAIIAFTAAIEIDPKQAPAYVGRGDAYIGFGETKDNLGAAQVDYEKAIELDETCAEAYLGLAEVYIRQGEYDKALEILQEGLETTGHNEEIAKRLNEIDQKAISEQVIYNSNGGMEFTFRNGYRKFETLSSDEQNILKTCGEMLLAQSKEELLDLAKTITCDEQGIDFLTFWQDYKVNFRVLSREDDDYIIYNSVELELRPESGIGYYTRADYANHKPEYDPGGFFDETHAISQSITMIACPCEGWSWNGDYNNSSQYYLTLENSRHGQSDVSHTYQERGSIGNVIDGLHNGTVVETVIDVDSDHTSQSTISYYYDKGILLKWEVAINGEIYPHAPQTTDGIWIIYNNAQWHYSDRQSLLDRLYW